MPTWKKRNVPRHLSAITAAVLDSAIAVGRKADDFLFQHMVRHGLLLQVEGGGGGGGGGGGEDPPKITPEIQKLIDTAIETAVTGLKAKNTELIGDQKRLKDKLAEFDGIDPEPVRALLKRFANDEEAALIKAGKFDEVLEQRTAKMREDFAKQLEAAKGEATSSKALANTFKGRVLDDAVRAAATKAGLHQHAIDDALFRARSMFTLDESGQAVQLGEDGKPVLGKDGKSPFNPTEWLDGMKEKAPHWFPASASGGGAGGGGKGNQGGKTMTRAAFEALEPADRSAAMAAKTVITD